MDEIAKWLDAGATAVLASIVVWLFRENRALYERLIAKSTTDSDVNKAASQELKGLLQAIITRRKPKDE